MKSLVLFAALMFSVPLFAADPVPTPVAVVPAAPAAQAAPAGVVQAPVAQPAVAQDQVPVSDFLGSVLKAVKDFGGLSWVMRVALVITLLLSSMKVTVLNDLIWSKLGNFKAWAAPVLGLAAGIASLASQGQLTWAGALAWVSAGAGAIILHELLDTVKAIPGLGAVWIELIDVISSFLGGPKSEDKKA